jgi:hypothetical protein
MDDMGDTGDGDSGESESGGETGPSAVPTNGGRCSVRPERGNLSTYALVLGLCWLACVRRRRG